MTFDAFDRLTQQGAATYAYDALDRVTSRNGTTFQYTGASNELTTDGTTTFSRGPADELLALSSGTDKRLIVSDQHGDVIASFDPTLDQVSDSAAYDPFGKVTDTTGTERPIGYQGDYTDPDTGQVNMTARWYDPGSGAFTSRDDASLPTSPSSMANRYNYAAAAPTNYTDPTGHFPLGPNNPCAPVPDTGILAFGRPCGGDSGSSGGVGLSGGTSGSLTGFINGPGSGNGLGYSGGAGTSGGTGASGTAPRPDPSTAARQANRAAAMNNPLPIPGAMLAPLYGNSMTAPVSSAPDLPSHETGDYQDPVDDINESYNDLQKSLTTDNETLLGSVADTAAAPTEVTPVNYQPDYGDDADPIDTIIEENAPRTNNLDELISTWQYFSSPGREGFWNMGMGDGEYACFGRAGCQEAWLYILENPDDIAGAKEIAATYCIYHFDECAGNGDFEEFVSDTMTDLVSLGRGRGRSSCSFDGSTAVLMADGARKPIAEVAVGDEVLAVDPATGERAPRKVTALIVHQDTVLDLVADDGSRITTTEDHPFWNVTNGGWERADQLDPGDALLTADGNTVRVAGLDPASERTVAAYNLTVDVFHTYYVGVGSIAVHNACPQKGGGPRLNIVPAPKDLAAFPDAKPVKPKTSVQGGGKLRKRWVDSDHIYEWDYKKGEVEMYDRSGKKHLGGFDPITGKQISPAVPRRTTNK